MKTKNMNHKLDNKLNNKQNNKKMKKLIFFVAAVTVMAACTSDEFVGTENLPTSQEKGEITFSSNRCGDFYNFVTGFHGEMECL